ncbi:NACHT domain-containing protein [Nostoc sp. ChiQUE01b]|uniref:NACHT domain-containing protein n=1 Tax=Nostoc sp. ChiQUE01b TaxID=3075376 RepID=UPI002AD2FD86|nr:NACHT domain-containing protein [Nostoc sp. ChiQUE01b]MDZ8262971.1 NACHT domain-containing protein [Nostoc sp. ChiQUE01b]
MTGFESITLAAAKSLTGIVIKFGWDSGSNFLQRLPDKIQQKIFNASNKYIESYEERHGTLKVLGMQQPVKLQEIYAEVQFLGEEERQQFISVANLEQVYRQSPTRKFQLEKCQKQNGLEVANQKQYLMVLGQPGAGKSTFLRRIGLEAIKGTREKYQHECIPVFLELKQFNNENIDLEKAISEELENCGFPDAEASTNNLLEKGKLLILLDGLDEIPTAQLDAAITQIENFVDKHNQNRFIASCRTAAYQSRFKRFVDVVMADFDDTQIEQFITNWFQSEEDKRFFIGQRCWKLLQQSEYAATKELAQTPLLLTLLCLVFDDSQTFPKNRASLYDDALDVLLKRWAAEKRIQREPIYQNLTIALEKMMLAEIAYKTFEADLLFFPQREIVQQIYDFLASNLNAPKHLDGEDILEAIQIQQGIFVERARDVISFSHLTFQEYLTAQHIADNNLIEKLVTNYLTDTRWREVFLLVAGLMRGGADQLLLLMETEVRKYMNSPKLRNLQKWIEEKTTGYKGDLKPVGRRANAYSYAINIAIAYTYATNTSVFTTIAYPYIRENAFSYSRPIANLYITGNHDHFSNYAFTKLYINPIAIANGNLDVNTINDAINDFIKSCRQLDKLKIFKAVNFGDIINQLEELKNKIPSNKFPPEERLAFLGQLLQSWFIAFDLTPEMINLSKEEFKRLTNYFYGNYLIIQCKEAAVRLAPTTWQAIEDRMLLVPSD